MKFKTKLKRHLKPLWPAPIEVSSRERWRVAAGIALALVLIALFWRLLGSLWTEPGHRLGLLAPLGASALLVFAVPASPMAQPWPVVVGNTLSVAVGLLAAHLLPWPELALCLAMPLCILLMYASRSLHPPGAAMALLMVLAGPDSDVVAMLACGLGGSVLMVIVAAVFNPATGKRYPVRIPV
jgi:CBS domain-containing membrane protein